jgi:hypothetical protein
MCRPCGIWWPRHSTSNWGKGAQTISRRWLECHLLLYGTPREMSGKTWREEDHSRHEGVGKKSEAPEALTSRARTCHTHQEMQHLAA